MSVINVWFQRLFFPFVDVELIFKRVELVPQETQFECILLSSSEQAAVTACNTQVFNSHPREPARTIPSQALLEYMRVGSNIAEVTQQQLVEKSLVRTKGTDVALFYFFSETSPGLLLGGTAGDVSLLTLLAKQLHAHSSEFEFDRREGTCRHRSCKRGGCCVAIGVFARGHHLVVAECDIRMKGMRLVQDSMRLIQDSMRLIQDS